jgi:L-ascorbate metabolism protein UlaG (beta-lactamase superfamily)
MKNLSDTLLLIILLCIFNSALADKGSVPVSVHYLGHCAFVISFDDTLDILTDYAESYPYYSADYNSPIYSIGTEKDIEVATFSHQHTDHYSPSRLPEGIEYMLQNQDTLLIGDVLIKPARTSESNASIPDNSTYFFYYGGLTFCHSGDLSANLLLVENAAQQEHLQGLFPDTVDVLFLAIQGVSGFIEKAEEFIDFLKPRIVIPMHYWTPSYKTEFLEYLIQENLLHGKTYEIVESLSADYIISPDDSAQVPTRIVSLTPTPFGIPLAAPGDIAFRARAYASRSIDINHRAERITDGYSDTRWQSIMGSSADTLAVCLEDTEEINGLVFNWLSKVKSYEIQISLDSSYWETVYFVTGNTAGLVDSVVFNPVSAKYIRINLLERSSSLGFGLYSLEIYKDMQIWHDGFHVNENDNTGFKVFPLPASAFINFLFPDGDSGSIMLTIIDSAGKIYFSGLYEKGSGNGYHLRLDVSMLKQGIYFYQARTALNVYSGIMPVIRH